jgi:hypothetical protein
MENDKRVSTSSNMRRLINLFDKLFVIFKELITHTSGDFDEAIDWLRTRQRI